MKKRVLLIGSERTLLETRLEVLQANGILAEMRLVNSVPHDLLASTDASLVVACSSLSAEARQAVVQCAHAATPKLLCLVVEPAAGPSIETADSIVGALEGPRKFISCVREMISHEPPSQPSESA